MLPPLAETIPWHPTLLTSLPAEALLQRRLAVATAVNEQIGVSIASVDVYIDSLVFPKE